MPEDASAAAGWASPRIRAFFAARSAVIEECRRRKAEIDTECTERLEALRAEYEEN